MVKDERLNRNFLTVVIKPWFDIIENEFLIGINARKLGLLNEKVKLLFLSGLIIFI